MDFIQAHMLLWGVLAALCGSFIVLSQLSFIMLMFGGAASAMASSRDKEGPRNQARTLLDQSPMNRRPAPFAQPIAHAAADPELSEREAKKVVGSVVMGTVMFGLSVVGVNVFGVLFVVAALANIFR